MSARLRKTFVVVFGIELAVNGDEIASLKRNKVIRTACSSSSWMIYNRGTKALLLDVWNIIAIAWLKQKSKTRWWTQNLFAAAKQSNLHVIAKRSTKEFLSCWHVEEKIAWRDFSCFVDAGSSTNVTNRVRTDQKSRYKFLNRLN